MKTQILRNAKGKVVAAFRRTPDALVSVEPVVKKGEKLEEIEVREGYGSDPDAFFEKNR